MGLSIRPLRDSDRENMHGEITVVARKKEDRIRKNTTSSRAIFEDENERAMQLRVEHQDIFNRRGYINLVMPVVNPFLCMANYTLLTKLLAPVTDKYRVQLVSIIKGIVVFDVELDAFVESKGVSDKYDSDKYLIGAYAVKKLMQELDCSEVITGKIAAVVGKYTKDMEDVHVVYKPGYTDGGALWIVDDYYVQGVQDEQLVEKIRESLPYNDLKFWFRLRDRKDAEDAFNLEDLILTFLPVYPIGFRPMTVSNKVDPITYQYDKIVNQNQVLLGYCGIGQSSVAEVCSQYANLVREVEMLMVGIKGFVDNKNKDFKPIVDTMKGKTGLIRERMEGVRVDFSGRAVIIVDPYMPVDTVGIPRAMAGELMSLNVLNEICEKLYGKDNGGIRDTAVKALRRDKEKLGAALLRDSYAIVGRQPTLYYLGIKAFKVKIVEGNAIVMSPLATPSFNADFDGDQMHTEVPITFIARRDVEGLMASTKNLFLPRNGECHIAPRQEIIHGLWLCTTVEVDASKEVIEVNSIQDLELLFENVCEQKADIRAEVSLFGYKMSAGRAAVHYAIGAMSCKSALGVFPIEYGYDKDKPVSEGWFKKLLGHVIVSYDEDGVNMFVDMTSKLCKLGFSIVNIFPPNMTIMGMPSFEEYIKEFDSSVEKREELYNLGFETEESFLVYYEKEYAKLEEKLKGTKKVSGLLKQKLPSECGYVELVSSGARGSMSNVMQLFGMKGRVVKRSGEAFKAIIKKPLIQQLSGLEHFVAAYGSREGLREKSIATDEPGYMYRKTRYACCNISIKDEDCGCTEGLVLDWDMLKQFIPNNELTNVDVTDDAKVKDYAVALLQGRYVFDDGITIPIRTAKDAEVYYKKNVANVVNGKFTKFKGINLRSPITCKKTCCVKCYGKDLTTNKRVVVGTPIGYIASQAIGEPGTQLTMKNFQSGGVAGVVNLTSSFDELQSYMDLADFKKAVKSKPIFYDFISPYDGEIRVIQKDIGDKVQIGYYDEKGKWVNRLSSNVNVIVPKGTRLKACVKRGESICEEQGKLSMPEVIEYRGVDYAQKYLALKLYDIFYHNQFVDLKHFEVLVAGATAYRCLKSGGYFKVGLDYTKMQYERHIAEPDAKDSKFVKVLHKVHEVPFKKKDIMSNVLLEDIRGGLSEGIVLSGYDELEEPETRIALGLKIKEGSSVPGFIETRGRINF